jgi:hypothetical protein
MQNIIYQITSYIKKHSLPNQVKVVPVKEKTVEYTLVYFCYRNVKVDIFVYNPTFISIKLNAVPYAFCDNIQTVRQEIDKLNSTYYYA